MDRHRVCHSVCGAHSSNDRNRQLNYEGSVPKVHHFEAFVSGRIENQPSLYFDRGFRFRNVRTAASELPDTAAA